MATKNKDSMTNWISVKTKPMLTDWYDVRYRGEKHPHFKRRYFDGAEWRFRPDSGPCMFGNVPGEARYELWRGLASDPSKAG